MVGVVHAESALSGHNGCTPEAGCQYGVIARGDRDVSTPRPATDRVEGFLVASRNMAESLPIFQKEKQVRRQWFPVYQIPTVLHDASRFPGRKALGRSLHHILNVILSFGLGGKEWGALNQIIDNRSVIFPFDHVANLGVLSVWRHRDPQLS